MKFNFKYKKEKDIETGVNNDIADNIENENSEGRNEGKKKLNLDSRTTKIIIICLVAAIVCASCVACGLIIARMRGDSSNEAESTSSVSDEQTTQYSQDVLDAILNQQMMYVNGINYYYQTSSQQLLHDAMGASVFNNSTVNVKSFVVAFCAFDASGNAVKIVQPDEQSEGGFVRTINYDFANAQGEKQSLAPNETCKDILMYVKNEPQIVTIKACVKSYVSTDDVTWENPYYQAFIDMYCGKSLNDSAQQSTAPISETTTMPNTVPGETTTMPNTVPQTGTTVLNPNGETQPNTYPNTQPNTSPNTTPSVTVQ